MALLAVEIKENRKKLKLSQRKLAQIIGVSEIAVSRWENGLMCPNDEIRNIKNSINKIQLAYKKLKKS